jgi:hypothetical protein
MKFLGDIYSDSFDNKNQWYHIIWFYIAFIGIFIYLTPWAIWRKMTGRKTEADIQAEKYRDVR